MLLQLSFARTPCCIMAGRVPMLYTSGPLNQMETVSLKGLRGSYGNFRTATSPEYSQRSTAVAAWINQSHFNRTHGLDTDGTHQVYHPFQWLCTKSLDFSHVIIVVADANLLSGLPGSVVVEVIVRREYEGALCK